MTNEQLVRLYLESYRELAKTGTWAVASTHNNSMRFEGRVLYSYDVPIAYGHSFDVLFINIKGYSTTTTKHQNAIRDMAINMGFAVKAMPLQFWVQKFHPVNEPERKIL